MLNLNIEDDAWSMLRVKSTGDIEFNDYRYDYTRFGVFFYVPTGKRITVIAGGDEIPNKPTPKKDDQGNDVPAPEKLDEVGYLGVFAQGFETKDMPTKGTAEYRGEAFGFYENNMNNFRGSTNLTVDFGKKTVTGKLSDWKRTADSGVEVGLGIAPIDIDARIKGNKFRKDDGSIEGKFFGPKGAELSGVATKEVSQGKKAVVAFGGIKQEK